MIFELNDTSKVKHMFSLFKKKEVKKDIYIENDIGKFLVTTFGKTSPMLEGAIDWGYSDSIVMANIICDANDESVQANNLEYLRVILENKKELDENLRQYIVNKHVEDDGLVHIWGDGSSDKDPEPISGAAFYEKLYLSYIRIYEDATAEFVFPADGLYTDHDLVVRVDHELHFEECVLEG